MNYRMTVFMALTFISIGAFASIANADTWALPKKEKYYSPNKEFYLEVTPKKLESQLKYFRDKVEGRENAGASKEEKDNRAKASFYARRAEGGYSKKWDFSLVNEVSPVSALVSSKGDYVVTFDNWHSVGYGDDVVVIYRSDGVLTLSGHPLLRHAAVAAALKWKFEPIEALGDSAKAIGAFAINFKLTVGPMNNERK